jgi:hypothetical protein
LAILLNSNGKKCGRKMRMLTETMKFWLKELYLNEAEDHLETARFEHLCALGSPDGEAAMLHEMNAEEHRAFAVELQYMAKKIEEEN